jgi:hypothetical protein
LWPSRITGNLYLSGEVPSCNLKLLKDLCVTHIVVCSEQSACLYPSDFHYLKLSVDYSFASQVEAVSIFVNNAISNDAKSKVSVFPLSHQRLTQRFRSCFMEFRERAILLQ